MASKRTGGDFLTAAKAVGQRQRVDVPGIDRAVYACTLSAADVRQITESCILPGKKATDGEAAFDENRLTLMLIAASIQDAQGKRLIPDGRESEIDEIPNAIKAALQSAALAVNGMGQAVSPGNA